MHNTVYYKGDQFRPTYGPSSTLYTIINERNCTNYIQTFRYQTTGRQLIGCIIPQAALHSLLLLMMGKIVARNMSS